MLDNRFQVNLGGMIEILSDHLYSKPDVYIRELLQNSVDAISARKNSQQDFSDGEIYIRLEEGKYIEFSDNGIGLDDNEIMRFLTVIGESSKKDVKSGRIMNDYIGRFGIGLLSCFMVTDEICVKTKSCHSNESFIWVGKPNGTYTLDRLDEELSVGTKMCLNAKDGCERYFTKEVVEQLILYYGLLLPYPIILDDGNTKKQINPTYLPWDGRETNKQELMLFGQMIFGIKFFDCVLLHSKEGMVNGVAYILPYTVSPTAKQEHRIYLKNMLLTEKGENILPDWAVFTKCIINAKNLRPTASREGFYEEEILSKTREDLGRCISDYLIDIAKNDEFTFSSFLKIHNRTVKGLAIDDDELYKIFIDYLEFNTTKGIMTGLELRLVRETLLYCSFEKYNQLSQIFFAQGRTLINVGYVFDRELLLKMPEFFNNVEVMQVNEDEVEETLMDLSVKDYEKTCDFVDIAERVLSAFDCEAQVKRFMPSNLPVFFYIDENAMLYKEIVKVKEESDELFGGMLDNFSEDFSSKKKCILYFNFSNPLVRKMIEVEDEKKLTDFIVILYVQALLIGGFPLKKNELSIMSDRLLNIMEDSINE